MNSSSLKIHGALYSQNRGDVGEQRDKKVKGH